jgi:hypothetical protein
MLLKNSRKKLLKHTIKFVSRLYDKPLAPPTDREKELIEEIRAGFSGLPISETTHSSGSEKEWYDYANSLKKLVINCDPREFLRWHVISGTMFVKYASYIMTELKYLKSSSDWQNRWREAIKESQVGHPVPYWQYPSSSGNLIHHAYHLVKFEEKTEMYINKVNYILEFGGGYGSMCRLIHNLDFQGKYVIFDLPSFSILQEYFLKSIGVKVHSFDSFKAGENGVLCISDLEQLSQLLSCRTKTTNSMFIATWSISEAPVKIRDSILPFVSSFNEFLIAYQHQFHEVNNVVFFENWKALHKDIDWYEWEIEHMPENSYLLGKRKANY